jgi:alanine-glyoxylate transaminase/serine-glyoxylate transaminase/serine-pyruvate transaminase
MTSIPDEFVPPPRLLMGPGPSDVAPSVLRAMAQPLVGHLDPVFVKMMEEIKAMLRVVFQTKNDMTFPVSGTGSAGMEFCCVNLIEPGDEVIIGVNGVFGTRMCDVAERCGAKVTKVEAEVCRHRPCGDVHGRAHAGRRDFPARPRGGRFVPAGHRHLAGGLPGAH